MRRYCKCCATREAAAFVRGAASTGGNDVGKELARAQLRIAQLACSPHTPALERVITTLAQGDRDIAHAVSEFRYTQMALLSSHHALRDELQEMLKASMSENDETRWRACVRAGAEQMLRRNLGFRSTRVSDSAPITHARVSSLVAPVSE